MLSIYDGHGGLMAAEFARDHMSEALLENIKKYDNNLEDALRHSFIKVNNLFTKYLQNNYRGWSHLLLFDTPLRRLRS